MAAVAGNFKSCKQDFRRNWRSLFNYCSPPRTHGFVLDEVSQLFSRHWPFLTSSSWETAAEHQSPDWSASGSGRSCWTRQSGAAPAGLGRPHAGPRARPRSWGLWCRPGVARTSPGSAWRYLGRAGRGSGGWSGRSPARCWRDWPELWQECLEEGERKA